MIPEPEPVGAWIVHSANGITALAMPVCPINDEAAPDAPGTAPDPTEGAQP